MGNHSIDCKFCGEDQRLVGLNCCAASVKQRHDEETAREAKRDKLRAFVRAIDPTVSFWSHDTIHLPDVVRLIELDRQARGQGS